MTNRALALLSPLALVSLLASAPVDAQATQASLAAKIDAIAAAQLAKPGGVGLSIAVAQRGRILHSKGYGKADLEFDAPANDQTMFRIGSVTKQFTAALVLRLVEQNKLTLDDELSKYVPDFPLQGRKVTIRHLLQHTSGIKSYTSVGERWEKVWPLELTHTELLALVKDAPFDFEPGTDHRYNNTGYYLLGMVIEKVAGRTYAQHLHAEICAPLELTRTRYDSNRDVIRNRAQGYGLDGAALVNDQMIGMAQPGAAGGILSTAADLVRWQMALTSGRFITRESFDQMRTPTVLPGGRDTHYGFGVAISEWEGKPRVQHGGGIFGFNSMLTWLPDEDLHVAVITNGEPISSQKIADAISYPALGMERPAVKDEPIKAELIARLAGDFVLANGRAFKVFERAGKLMVQATGQDAFRILWQGGDEYRAEFDTDVRLVFADDGKSMVLFQSGKKIEAVRK